jgi:hypothetical protein
MKAIYKFLGTNQVINLMSAHLKQDQTYVSLQILFSIYLPISSPLPPSTTIHTAKKKSLNIKVSINHRHTSIFSAMFFLKNKKELLKNKKNRRISFSLLQCARNNAGTIRDQKCSCITFV